MTGFASNPIPGHQGPPASASPVADYLGTGRQGVSADRAHLVLPRSVIEQLPLPVQQQLVGVLQQMHEITANAPWPVYRVAPARWAKITELEETGLRELGLIAEFEGEDGETLVYRDIQTGRQLQTAELERPVLVSIKHDPMLQRPFG